MCIPVVTDFKHSYVHESKSILWLKFVCVCVCVCWELELWVNTIYNFPSVNIIISTITWWIVILLISFWYLLTASEGLTQIVIAAEMITALKWKIC